MVHEHHARRLHWDLRLEREGVLMSWAIPNGIPRIRAQNRKAIHVEDHPLSYIDFEGEIPQGSYGAGRVSIWDSGSYDCEKFTDGSSSWSSTASVYAGATPCFALMRSGTG